MSLPESLENLIHELNRLPGIGKRTAQRLALHLVDASGDDITRLSTALLRVKETTRRCSVCHNLTETDPCYICANPRRDASMICVVEDPKDLISIEKTNQFKGQYHVLGGVLSPLDGIGPEDLHIKTLLKRISPNLKEIILAISPTTEGEATSIYLSKLIKPLNVKVTRIARGIPIGGDLELSSDLTISKAILERIEI